MTSSMTLIVLCSFLAGIAACIAFVNLREAIEPIRRLLDIRKTRRSMVAQLRKVA